MEDREPQGWRGLESVAGVRNSVPLALGHSGLLTGSGQGPSLASRSSGARLEPVLTHCVPQGSPQAQQCRGAAWLGGERLREKGSILQSLEAQARELRGSGVLG